MQYAAAARGYANLWARMEIRPERLAAARRIANELAANRARYEAVAAATGVTWHWIAIVHHLESGHDFRTHLHNGDSLARRTVHVPAGRPASGSPPFTWEESAIDALRLKGLHQETDWSIPKQLWQFERYNGFGYVKYGVNSPYVWSFSNLYSHGKYIADGRYSASAVSQQCGAAVILRAMIDAGYVDHNILISVGLVQQTEKTEHEEHMSPELSEFAAIIARAAPTVAGAFGGPLASFAVRAIADQLDTEAEVQAVANKLRTSPLEVVIEALGNAERVFQRLMPIGQVLPSPVPHETPAPAVEVEMPTVAQPKPTVAPTSPNGVLVDPTASVAKTLVAGLLFVLCSLFIKDAALAQTTANMLAPLVEAGITAVGGGILTWLLHRSVSNANANTVAALGR